MSPGAWVAVSLRPASRAEWGRARRWYEHRLAGGASHYSRENGEVVVGSIFAGASSSSEVDAILLQLIAAIPGFDLDVAVRRAGRCRAGERVGCGRSGRAARGGDRGTSVVARRGRARPRLVSLRQPPPWGGCRPGRCGSTGRWQQAIRLLRPVGSWLPAAPETSGLGCSKMAGSSTSRRRRAAGRWRRRLFCCPRRWWSEWWLPTGRWLPRPWGPGCARRRPRWPRTSARWSATPATTSSRFTSTPDRCGRGSP